MTIIVITLGAIAIAIAIDVVKRRLREHRV